MAYVKHPEHGNKHVSDHEVAALVARGWVKWPRAPEDKALGDGSDAAYWRKKAEQLQAEQQSAKQEGDGHLEAIAAQVVNEFPTIDAIPTRNKPGPKPKK